MTTIEEAKAKIKESFYAGKITTCPCCSQTIKLYKRKITSTAVQMLIKLYLNTKQGEFVHVNEFGKGIDGSGGGDFAKLKFWALIQEHINLTNKKRTSGLWMITDRGRDFIAGKIKVYKYALVYNQKLLGFDTKEETDIRDCLGEHFNYEQLMKQ